MHKALYRIYRPKMFSDIVGQSHITQILKNQIAEGSISHAYLFSGGRGTGKTSTAKVFAKAINCENMENSEPCFSCRPCMDGDIDIIEIDAASNNSVDNIRELRDNVAYTPSYGKYKVYIIDEVHMLSQGAFNALLKTLEEPPPHVVFILATTEPQKIPPTVLSRCQRFDFRKIDKSIIIDRMKDILRDIKTEYEDEALELISQKAEGGMRDALSLLDQSLSYGPIKYEKVIEALGDVSHERLHEVIEAISSKTPIKAIEILDFIFKSGKDVKLFLSDYIQYLRDVLVFSSGGKDILSHDEHIILVLQKSAEIIDVDSLINQIEFFSELENKIKYSQNSKVLLEAGFIRASRFSLNKEGPSDSQINDLLDKINALDLKIQNLENGKEIKKESPVQKIIKKNTQSPIPHFDDISNQVEIGEEEKNILEHIKSRMDDVFETLRKEKNAHLKALLLEGEPVRFLNNVLYIGYDENHKFHKQTIDTDINRDYMSNVFEKVLKKTIKTAFIFKREISDIKDEGEDSVIDKIKSSFPGVPLEILDSEEDGK